jgi:N-acyl-D-amino-acid deacylase
MRYLLAAVSLLGTPVYSQQADLLIRNGLIVDGAGNSWFYGDVAVRDGGILAVGRLEGVQATRVIDASGLVVAPGFIDVHTHIEGNDRRVPTADNFIFDGVTTVVTGNCGGSEPDIAEYFRQLDSVKTSINVSTLIGHNTVRGAVMGDERRDPSPDEQSRMEALVEKAMKDGAVGLSTGLIYVPGTYSNTNEVVGLAKAAARFGGVYASHIRDEGDNVTEAIEEAINIGREASLPVQISHFKVTYKPNWGRSAQTLAQVENAREEGHDVTIDQYPYVASSTTLNTRLPTWVFGGGPDSVMYRLKNTDIRGQIRAEMLKELKGQGMKNWSYALVARYGADSTMNGKTISEVNRRMGRKPAAKYEAETIMDMVEKGSAQMVFFSMDEKDLVHFMKYPFNMVASDAGVIRMGSGVPHPRGYGTNARVLGRYVRDQKVIRLEEAIRRMTSLPAQKFNLRHRGLLREGMAADIVIFDEATVGDLATFEKPHQHSAGFRYVIVNGQVVVDQGRHTGVRSGDTLKGPGFQRVDIR